MPNCAPYVLILYQCHSPKLSLDLEKLGIQKASRKRTLSAALGVFGGISVR